MYVRERQCIFGRDNVSSGESMWLPERECVFPRDNVSSRENVPVSETYRVFLGHKITSRSSADVLPASIRIKMIQEIRWSCRIYPKYLKKTLICFQTNCQHLRRCKIENYTILRVQTLGLPKTGGDGGRPS